MCKKRENSTNPAIKGLPSSFAFLCLFVSYKRAFGVENDTLVKDMTIKNGKAFCLAVLRLLFFSYNELPHFQASMILTSRKPLSESHG